MVLMLSRGDDMRIGKDGDNDLVKVVSNGRTWWNYYRGFSTNAKEYDSVKSFDYLYAAMIHADGFNEKYYLYGGII